MYKGWRQQLPPLPRFQDQVATLRVTTSKLLHISGVIAVIQLQADSLGLTDMLAFFESHTGVLHASRQRLNNKVSAKKTATFNATSLFVHF